MVSGGFRVVAGWMQFNTVEPILQDLLQKKFHCVELFAMSIWNERQIDVARRLGRPKSVICRWFKLRKVPVSALDEVERLYGDKREDLRPDMPWRKE